MRQRLMAAGVWLWGGCVLGVSFIATPVKFMAQLSTKAALLEIGKLTFLALNKVEWGILVVLAALSVGAKKRHYIYGIGGAALILLVQTFYLLPVLLGRIEDVRHGVALAPSWLHPAYVFLEAAKVFLLIYTGYRMMGDE